MKFRALWIGLAAAAAIAFSAHASDAGGGEPVGDQQSPVNIVGTIPAKIKPFVVDYRSRDFDVTNDGHTIKVTPVGGTNTVAYDGKVYTLSQFHFHHKSEHEVNGVQTPMELHFVNTLDGDAVVLGVFLDTGAANAAFKAIMDAAPASPGPSNRVRIDPNTLLPKDRHYWTYMGSLTTPPYSQIVRWIVLRHGVKVDPASIDKFVALYPDSAREVQPLDRRFILSGP
ncbi:MAG: carbonic anhydrase family protein [Rhizomicrobium sp.]